MVSGQLKVIYIVTEVSQPHFSGLHKCLTFFCSVTFDDLWTKTSKSSHNCQTAKDILGKCMSGIPSDRPSSIELLEMTREYVMDELPRCAANLHGLYERSEAGGYLQNSLYLMANQFDTKEAYEIRSVRLRRDILIRRLNNLCDDGAGVKFDTQPGLPDRKLLIAVLLNREAAFEQALKWPQAVNSRWSDSGWTPLHLAAQERNVTMYNQLLQGGADPLVHDESGHIANFYIPRRSTE